MTLIVGNATISLTRVEIVQACSSSTEVLSEVVFPYVRSVLAVGLFGVAFSSYRLRNLLSLRLRAAVLIGLVGPIVELSFIEPLQDFMELGVQNSVGVLTSKSDYVYFSVVTFTTLGYGDMLPCPSARHTASALALTGFFLFPLLIAALFMRLTERRSCI